ncbi:MAG: right-handed parallel beta-helix repeat-containing protein [Methylococcales bacterium]|nr:right-handed parallel beta-helix repeat-containing protein [Methylococcales bacterium]
MKTILRFVLFIPLYFIGLPMVASATEYQLSPSDNWFSMISGDNLQPGDVVILSQGTYSDGRRLSISHKGTAQAPIIIRSKAGEVVTITRPNINQNTLNIEGAQHLILRELEVTGGSAGIRIGSKDFNGNRRQAEFITLENCHIHHTAEAAITANFPGDTNTGHKYLHNEIHHTGGTGEAFYLGTNNDGAGNTKGVFRDGLIEGNYIHHLNDSTISQGDGIEIKDGSYNNIIRDNVIHDTKYPGILVYGTDGNAPNIIEGNVVWSSGDNGIQAASEAIITNNIIFDSAGSGIQSQNHQSAVPGSLSIIHNTIIANGGNAIRVNSPTGGSLNGSIVIANNALYSAGGLALRLPAIAGFTIKGNRGVGGTQPSQPSTAWNSGGNPNVDFSNLGDKDVYPGVNSLLVGSADGSHTIDQDFNGTQRIGSLDVGAYTHTSNLNPGWKIKPEFKVTLSGTTLLIPSNQWKQVALPLIPPTGNNTVAAIFGDDINGVYGTDWVLFGFDASNNKYVDPGLNGVITVGTGYWIYHTNITDVVVDLPVASTAAALTHPTQCPSVKGCFEITLATQENSKQSLMVGNPFPHNIVWSGLRVATSSGVCADADGCTLTEAKDLNIIENKGWQYNSQTNAYDIIQGGATIQSWDGFWMATLNMAHGLNPKLLLPVD